MRRNFLRWYHLPLQLTELTISFDPKRKLSLDRRHQQLANTQKTDSVRRMD